MRVILYKAGSRPPFLLLYALLNFEKTRTKRNPPFLSLEPCKTPTVILVTHSLDYFLFLQAFRCCFDGLQGVFAAVLEVSFAGFHLHLSYTFSAKTGRLSIFFLFVLKLFSFFDLFLLLHVSNFQFI